MRTVFLRDQRFLPMVRRLMEEGVVAREPHRFLILQPAALESYAAGKQPLHYL